MKKLPILLLAIFLSAGSLSAQSVDIKKLLQQAKQGDAKAQFTLGLMYDNGQGVPQDYVQAHMWFNLSAAQGDAYAAMVRDLNLRQRMTPQQIAQAEELARNWKPKKK
jgi:hypothetical protein